jgi:hypothetical protein
MKDPVLEDLNKERDAADGALQAFDARHPGGPKGAVSLPPSGETTTTTEGLDERHPLQERLDNADAAIARYVRLAGG